MKKNFRVKNWMFPMPVLMIGRYNEDGTPNMMNAAWGGIALEDKCFSIALAARKETFLQRQQEFHSVLSTLRFVK